ncbi:MAG: peptide deformylase, partial [Planctomycetota bacterium]
LRPDSVKLDAYDMQGNEISRRCSGMLAKVLQHELDHLDGVLFFDRILPENKTDELQNRLEVLEEAFQEQQAEGTIPSDETIQQRRDALLQQYC